MKFIFSRPEKSEGCAGNPFPKMWWELPILAWLKYNGVWFRKNEYGNKSYELDYNYLYDFFDISVFEDSKHPNPKEPIEKLEVFLVKSGLKFHDAGTTWTFVEKDKKMGKRFFIYAEKK